MGLKFFCLFLTCLLYGFVYYAWFSNKTTSEDAELFGFFALIIGTGSLFMAIGLPNV